MFLLKITMGDKTHNIKVLLKDLGWQVGIIVEKLTLLVYLI